MESFKIWIIGYVISTIAILIYKATIKKVDIEWITIYLGVSILLLVGFYRIKYLKKIIKKRWNKKWEEMII